MSTRIQQLFHAMEKQSIAFIFSGDVIRKTADQYYPFQVNKNFFYLTQLDLHQCVLVLVKHQQEDVILFAPTRTKEKEKWEGILPSFHDIKTITGINDVRNKESFESFHQAIFSTLRDATFGNLSHLYSDISVPERMCAEEVMFVNQIKTHYPEVSIHTLSHQFKKLRTFKDEQEIDTIKKAIDITHQGLNSLIATLKNEKKEHALHASFLHKIHQHQGKEAFDTIIASGKHATILHYVDNNDTIPHDGLVLCDLGAQINQYNADITRTYPASGVFTERQKQLYQMVLDVNQTMIEWVKPGRSFKDFKEKGKQLLAEKALQIGLINQLEDITQYYYHGLGHHLGLDVHDPCDYDELMQEGMILTVEPGIYIEEEGIGIRIEDDVLITKTGSINLSKDIPKSIEAIEALFK